MFLQGASLSTTMKKLLMLFALHDSCDRYASKTRRAGGVIQLPLPTPKVDLDLADLVLCLEGVEAREL